MADDFQTGGACSGSWWSNVRTGGFDNLAMAAAASASCSTPITDTANIGGGGTIFSWVSSELVEGKAPSSDEPAGSGSGSSITSLSDSALQLTSFGLASPTMDWNQSLLRSSGRAEPSFHAMLQESNQAHAGTEDFSSNQLLGFQLSSGSEQATAFPASYGCPSTLLQGLLETDNKLQQSLLYENQPTNYHGSLNELSQPLWARFPHLFKGSPPKQPTTNPLHFSNNSPFWNASAGAPVPAPYGSQPFEQKPASSNLTSKSNSQGSKKMGSEPAFKKPRIETLSPLPTFKVRKEKLGDRITALQQLVSPFGKTDTASVLHEAIDYIKFLHDQVGVLSTPYLKNGHPMQHQQNVDTWKDGEGAQRDLRSRGLCLVPIASTFPVASETTADFWTPTYGGTCR